MNPFDAAPLRGLDDASCRRIEAAGRSQVLADGEVLYEPGADADLLFVVLEGRVAVGGVRVAEPGHTLGEEAMLGLPRRGRAQADGAAKVFCVPAALLHRAWTRAGGRPAAAAERRRLERAVIGDLFRSALPRIDAWALELLLDGSSLRTVEAEGALARAGDPTPAAALILEGVAHVRTPGTRAVERVVSSPDALWVTAALAGDTWAHDVVAAGTCQVVWVRADALRTSLGAAARALETAAETRAQARAQVLDGMQAGPLPAPIDVFRLARARSLLVIDQDTCVRCGQCTRSCAGSHPDGLARMRRSGPRVVARLQSPSAPAAPWLLAQACQHCSSPACLPDCPTAAITRGPGGAVQIDPALCTGCGACAKACPWDAIELAPRPVGAPSPPEGPFEAVAVKCDLCVGSARGPACVRACPTQALARVDAAAEVVEVAALLDRPPVGASSPRLRPWPWGTSIGIAAALIGGAWGASQHGQHGHGWIAGAGPGLWMGWLAAAALLGSLAYAALRRLPAIRGVVGMSTHAILGALTFGAAWAHGGGAFGGLPGVLAGAVMIAAALGLYGLLAYRVLPTRLTRLEAEAADERQQAPDDADALMKAIGGRSDALKRLAAAVLLPYARRPGGGLRLLLSGRSLAQERARLQRSLTHTLGAERVGRLEGLDEVLATVVTMRAASSRVALRALLLAWLAPHVILSAVGLVLLLVHVVGWRGEVVVGPGGPEPPPRAELRPSQGRARRTGLGLGEPARRARGGGDGGVVVLVVAFAPSDRAAPRHRGAAL